MSEELTFEIGQKFEGEYPPQAAEWCNNNNACIVELESITKTVTVTSEFPDETGKRESHEEEKTFRVFEIQKVPDPTEEEIAESVRARRDSLIAETDYLMASDYPLEDDKKEELKVYRQALRDVPEQEGFPTEVVWPTKPEWLK